MNLEQITPLVLSYNEAPNIARTLSRLKWATDVVLVDSFSTDGTVSIAEQFGNVRVFQRLFDTHAGQWQYGLEKTAIHTPWVLALDADYFVTDQLHEELRELLPSPETSAFMARFVYAVFGRPIRGGAYPPVAVLFRRDACEYRADGHTQRLFVRDGAAAWLRSPIIHDDRKPLSRWLQSQATYMDYELKKLVSTPSDQLSRVDRMRMKLVVVPPLFFLYSLLYKRGILDGWHGWFYALQRFVAESLLSLKLLEHRLSGAHLSESAELPPAETTVGGRSS